MAAVNEHGWDGEWYLRATLDDGSLARQRDQPRRQDLPERADLGGARRRGAAGARGAVAWRPCASTWSPRPGRCFWRRRSTLPIPHIGYITRYAPGLRENGGVYTHAATWAIAAACKMRDHDLVGRLLTAINPAIKDPDRYWAEPYVLPGNVDGPASPHHGRGGWTWYTGSAAWLHRVIAEWVLGVRPEWDGLRIDPCLPLDWNHAEMTRPFRGHRYRIVIERSDALHDRAGAQITLDGVALASNLVPPPAGPAALHEVHVRCR